MSLGEMAQISQGGDREAAFWHVVLGMMIVGMMIWEWWVVVHEKTLRVHMIRCCDHSSTEDYRWGWRKCNWWTGEQRMDRNWREEIFSSMSTMVHFQRKKPMKTCNKIYENDCQSSNPRFQIIGNKGKSLVSVSCLESPSAFIEISPTRLSIVPRVNGPSPHLA